MWVWFQEEKNLKIFFYILFKYSAAERSDLDFRKPQTVMKYFFIFCFKIFCVKIFSSNLEIFCVKLFNGRKRWTWFDEASICVKRTLKWVDWQQNANSTANESENKQKFSKKSRRLWRKTNFWICCSIRLWFWENGAENVCGGRELIAFTGPLHIPSHSSQKFKKIFLLSIIVGNNVFSWKIL